jgi:hypothetical protein
MVRFNDDCEANDESACSSHTSCGELMEIAAKPNSESHAQNLQLSSLSLTAIRKESLAKHS